MSIGIWQIAILGAVLVLLFGSRKLPALGADIARGIKDFRAEFSAKKPSAVAEDAPFEDDPAHRAEAARAPAAAKH